jgi:endonuclease/exonuclease/phosphatase family metal-dependent hydrolase
MRLLVRTWNLFHGRSVPQTDTIYLEEMIALVTRDDPDVVCLQEVPVWAVPHLADWSGLEAVAAVSMPAYGGRLARRITAIEPRRLRSALTGQAQAILVSRRFAIGDDPAVLVLNPPAVRRRGAGTRRLPMATRIAWARDRRVAQLLRITAEEQTVVVVNLHLSSLADSRPADAELLRAASYAEGFAGRDEPIVLAGDLNATVASSVALRALGEWGFSAPAEGIDHILARGLSVVRGPESWPEERRRFGDVLLSDHAPVEAEMMLG